METIETLLEKDLRCRIIQMEGIQAIGTKIFWNHQGCTYEKICLLRKEKEAHQLKPCRYNPKMFKCSAYHFYAMAEDI